MALWDPSSDHLYREPATRVADIIRLPLTPEEAEAIMDPAVQQRIVEINSVLARGERGFSVYDGMVAPVKKALEMKGWEVEIGPDFRIGSRSFLVRPAARSSEA